MNSGEEGKQIEKGTSKSDVLAKPDSLSILARGEKFTARKLDGSTEEVTIRHLPLSQMSKLLASYGDESALVELYCAKEKNWADGVERDDCVQIAQIGDRANMDFFAKYLARQTARLDVLMPGASKELQKKMSSLTSASGLPASS